MVESVLIGVATNLFAAFLWSQGGRVRQALVRVRSDHHTMKRPHWLPQFTLGTASGAAAALIAFAFIAAIRGSRHAVAEAVRWLAHPVETPRIVFVLVLALAVSAGLMFLTWIGQRLFQEKTPTPRERAERFRSDWEKLADHLREWMEQEQSALSASNQERYRDLRRQVAKSYARAREDLAQFLNHNATWDLREPLSIEIDSSMVAHEEISEPFEEIWRFDNLPSAMQRVREMNRHEFSSWIGKRSDALDAFVDWMSDR
jgi:hypothetical protein